MVNELIATIRGCTICRDSLDPNPIIQLAPVAKILIASQAPGRIAHESGVPFQDASGRRLRQWLGLSEDHFYNPDNVAILPMAFCFPGGGRQGDLPPPVACAERWRQECLDLLQGVELTLLIGQYAQAWHLGPRFQSVTETVSGWEAFAPAVFPLPHPSPRNTPWIKRHPWFEEELVPALQGRVSRVLYK